MSNETVSPLSEPKPRDPRDEKLVGQVLGPRAEAEMEELVGEVTRPAKKEALPDELELSEDELVNIEEVQNLDKEEGTDGYTRAELEKMTRLQLNGVCIMLGVLVDIGTCHSDMVEIILESQRKK